MQRQNSDLQCRIEELEEELDEIKRKQRRSVLTTSTPQNFNTYAGEMNQLIEERNAMREEIANLQERLVEANTEKTGVSLVVLMLGKK